MTSKSRSHRQNRVAPGPWAPKPQETADIPLGQRYPKSKYRNPAKRDICKHDKQVQVEIPKYNYVKKEHFNMLRKSSMDYQLKCQHLEKKLADKDILIERMKKQYGEKIEIDGNKLKTVKLLLEKATVENKRVADVAHSALKKSFAARAALRRYKKKMFRVKGLNKKDAMTEHLLGHETQLQTEKAINEGFELERNEWITKRLATSTCRKLAKRKHTGDSEDDSSKKRRLMFGFKPRVALVAKRRLSKGVR